MAAFKHLAQRRALQTAALPRGTGFHPAAGLLSVILKSGSLLLLSEFLQTEVNRWPLVHVLCGDLDSLNMSQLDFTYWL